jgi:hypothetical protein
MTRQGTSADDSLLLQGMKAVNSLVPCLGTGLSWCIHTYSTPTTLTAHPHTWLPGPAARALCMSTAHILASPCTPGPFQPMPPLPADISAATQSQCNAVRQHTCLCVALDTKGSDPTAQAALRAEKQHLWSCCPYAVPRSCMPQPLLP